MNGKKKQKKNWSKIEIKEKKEFRLKNKSK